MKTKIDFFIHELFAETHKEIVFLPSIQYNYYGEVQSRYKWMKVLSIKFIVWEFGISMTKLCKKNKISSIKIINAPDNYYEHPIYEQHTSVPEKQLGDLEQ